MNELEIYARRDIATLLAEADVTGGRILIENKHTLTKIPHVITGFTYRMGATEGGFVSVEATTLLAGEGFDYGDDIVYNDSSPYGIRGELATYATAKGIVTGYTGSKDDVPWTDWTITDHDRASISVSSKGNRSLGISNIVLHVRTGLRVSAYEFNDGKIKVDAETFYLSTGAVATL